jgi:hypothetical protein
VSLTLKYWPGCLHCRDPAHICVLRLYSNHLHLLVVVFHQFFDSSQSLHEKPGSLKPWPINPAEDPAPIYPGFCKFSRWPTWIQASSMVYWLCTTGPIFEVQMMRQSPLYPTDNTVLSWHAVLEFDQNRFLDEWVQRYLTHNLFMLLSFSSGPRIYLV